MEAREQPVPLPWEGLRERKPRPWLLELTIRLFREKPLGAFGAVVCFALLFVAVLADVIAPFGYNEALYPDQLHPPSARYWFGTDNFARDMFSRVVYGARISLYVGFGTVLIAETLATVIGILTGYFMGWLDQGAQRLVDAWMSIPDMVLLLVLISFMGPGLVQVILAMAVLFGVRHSRIVRGTVLSVKENMYIEAARAMGCRPGRIMLRHILPNVMAPVIIMATATLGTAVLLEASLSFIGFGIPPPTPSWGDMLSTRARYFMTRAPWMALWPGIFLSLTVFGWGVFGDALRDLLDPRLRGAGGRFARR